MAANPVRRSTSSSGGIGRIATIAAIIAAYVAASNPYAQGRPRRPTIRPPRAGPTIMVVLKVTWFSATARDIMDRPTRRGTIAVLVGPEMPLMAAPSAAPVYT